MPYIYLVLQIKEIKNCQKIRELLKSKNLTIKTSNELHQLINNTTVNVKATWTQFHNQGFTLSVNPV